MTTPAKTLSRKPPIVRGWFGGDKIYTRKTFQRQRRMHDPMLVLNMSIFNLGNGWDRTFNPLKAHENGTR